MPGAREPLNTTTDNAGATGEFVKLRVVSQDGQEVQFRIKKSTLMGKLMKSYAERSGLQVASLRFTFDGRRITDSDTPATLEAEEDDVIEAYQEQTGGMKYVAAYMLASMGGKKEPVADDLEKILGSAGLDTSAESMEKVVSALKGKDIADVIAKGLSKLSSVNVSATSAAPQATTQKEDDGAKKASAEKKKGEEDDDFDMLGLFD